MNSLTQVFFCLGRQGWIPYDRRASSLNSYGEDKCSVPQWLRATMALCWNGHREARATMVRSCILIILYVYAVWMGGAGGGGVGDGLPMVSRAGWEGMGCQWLAGLVCRVCLCAIWMGGTGGGGGGGWGWVANG